MGAGTEQDDRGGKKGEMNTCFHGGLLRNYGWEELWGVWMPELLVIDGCNNFHLPIDRGA